MSVYLRLMLEINQMTLFVFNISKFGLSGVLELRIFKAFFTEEEDEYPSWIWGQNLQQQKDSL